MTKQNEGRRKRPSSSRRGAVLAGVAMSGLLAFSASVPPAAADELDEMKSELAALRKKVTAMEGTIEKMEGNQSVTRDTGMSGAVRAGDMGMDGTLYGPGSFKFPGTDTSIAIHGYFKGDFIYDIDASPAFRPTFEVSLLPVDGTAAANRDGQFTAHVKESRINLVTSTPTSLGALFTRWEVDAFAASSGFEEVTANGEAIGLRHAYGSLDGFLVGQTWSTFQPVHGFAPTLDFSGGVANSFVRNPMIQWSDTFGDGVEWAIAAENPQTDIQTETGLIDNTNGVFQLDQIPDIAAHIQKTTALGNLWLSGIARQIRVDNGLGIDSEEFGYGIHGLAVFNVGERDKFAVLGIYGDGVGRYINALGGTGSDAVLNTATGALDTLEAWSAGTWYQHWWSETVRSAAYFGYVEVENTALQPGSAFSTATQANVNLVWSPVPQVNVGIEYLYGLLELKDGREGEGQRVQASAQWLF